MVDRVLFSPDKPDEPGGTVDCVYLDNVVSYPIIRGRSNPAFARSSSHTALETQTTKLLIPSETISETVAYSAEALASSEHLVAIPEATLIGKRGLQPLPNWTSASDLSHEASLNAKRLRAQATAAAEVKNAIFGALHRERKRGATTNAASVKPQWDIEVSSTIADWSFGHIPEACWGVAGTESEYLFNSNTSSIELSDAGRALGMREYEFEPRSHAEAMARPSERTFWAEAEACEMTALVQMEFAEMVLIPEGAHLLPCIWLYKYKADIVFTAGIILRLLKSLYGFKQSERQWNRLVSSFLILIKFVSKRISVSSLLFVQDKLVAIIAI